MENDAIPSAKRPVVVVVVLIASVFATGIAFLTGISLLFPSAVWGWMWDLNRPAYVAFERLGRISGILLLVVGCVALIVTVGLLRRRTWAWLAAIAIFVINGLGDLAGLVVTHDVVRSGMGVLIAAMFVALLLTKQAKDYFERPPEINTASD